MWHAEHSFCEIDEWGIIAFRRWGNKLEILKRSVQFFWFVWSL